MRYCRAGAAEGVKLRLSSSRRIVYILVHFVHIYEYGTHSFVYDEERFMLILKDSLLDSYSWPTFLSYTFFISATNLLRGWASKYTTKAFNNESTKPRRRENKTLRLTIFLSSRSVIEMKAF